MPDDQWWLLHNSYGGIHLGTGRNAAEAKTCVLDAIAETYAGEGLPPWQCRRAAYSYHVRILGGPVSYAEACEAREAWNHEDWETALLHARPGWRKAYGLPARPPRAA